MQELFNPLQQDYTTEVNYGLCGILYYVLFKQFPRKYNLNLELGPYLNSPWDYRNNLALKYPS